MKERIPTHNRGRMDQEKAHEEANVLRAMSGVSPEKGTILEPTKPDAERRYKEPVKFREREPRPEDYEIALRELEELERLAERNPETITKLVQLMKVSFVGATIPLAILGGVLNEALNKAAGVEGKGYTGDIKETISTFKNFKDSVFSDARSKLMRMKEAGKKFGEEEAQGQRRDFAA